MKTNKVIIFGSPVLYIVVGVLLLCYSAEALNVICWVIAAALALVGAVSLISYLLRPAEENFSSNGFGLGLVLILLAVAIVLKTDEAIALVPMVLGFFVALNGVRELQNFIDALRLKMRNSWIVALLAVINLALGVLLMVNPFSAAEALMMALGIGLIVSGLVDLITTILVGVKSRGAARAQAEAREREAARAEREAKAQTAQVVTPGQEPPAPAGPKPEAGAGADPKP